MCVSIPHTTTGFHWYRTLLIIFTAVLLTGCASLFDPESSQEFNSHQIGIVDNQNTFGQVISSAHPILSGITVWLSRPDPGTALVAGKLQINIFENAASITPIYSTSISTTSIGQYSSILISLEQLQIPETGSFYIEFSSLDSEVILHGRLEDSYTSGQAYHNREPINADLAFRTTYLYGWNEFKLDIHGLVNNIIPISQIGLLLFLPGYTVVRLFRLNRKFSCPEQLAISAGLSLALIPQIYLFGSTAGFRITSSTITGIGAFCTIILITMGLTDRTYQAWINVLRYPKTAFLSRVNLISIRELGQMWELIGIILVVMVLRMIMIRDLATPAWVDSIHHGLITRVILDNGTLPETYLPYLDISTSAYHPGFHSILVAFLEISGLDISTGMLIFGQALNAVAASSIYLLTVTLTRKHTSGLIAALITCTFTAMPAYYTSWGRYPQLAGLIILPVAFSLTLAISQSFKKIERLNLLLCAALAMSGLLLVHYRVAAFLLCLFISWLLSEAIFSGKNVWRLFSVNIIYLLALGGLALLLSAPWTLNVIQETILPRLNPSRSHAPLNFFSDFSWHYLTPVFGKQTIVLTAVGMVWLFLKRAKVSIVVSGWMLLLFLIANLDALNLPGGSFVNNSSVAIMLFMPFSVISGHLIDQLFELWRQLLKGVSRILLALITTTALLYFAWLGSRQIISILNPTTLLSRQADLTAIHWIDQNIPDDEVILINSFAWGYNTFAGSDGGAWISALADNQTIPPPVLYGLGTPAQISDINALCNEVAHLATAPDELWTYLNNQSIEYIYIGARGGAISPAALATNQHYEILYHQDATWFFHLLP